MGAQEKIELLAALEEKYRRNIRSNLNEFCRYIEIPGAPLVEDSCELGDRCNDPKCTKHEVSTAFYPDTVEPAEHHRLLNKYLQKINDKEIVPETGKPFNRLMVFMPPGSAKSTYGSVTFPSFYMGNHPRENIICTSYASGLAKKFGRKVRAITSSDKYRELYNCELKKDNRAVDDWALTNESTYMAGGILSGITGNRANGLLIDDPVKGREDADSPTIREKTWEAYLSDLRTRLKPNGWIVIIQTRWHEDDLSGRILPDDWDGQSGWVTAKDGERWYILCLQAQCEREDDPLGRQIGEWLWTDWFTPEHWEKEKRVQGSRNWEALYQQRPKPAEGSIFKRAWVKRYRTPPSDFMRLVISVDTAFKEDQHNDPSVFGLWGETENRDYYLLDVWRDRVDYPALKRNLANFYLQRQRPADNALIEDKASGQSLIQELRAGLKVPGRPTKLFIPVVPIEPESSKLSRAIRVSPIVESGRLYLPEVAPWLINFESEFFGFPIATHDDQVDMVTQFLEWAVRTMHGIHVTSSGTRKGISLSDGSQIEQTDDYVSIGGDIDFDGF